MPHSSGEVPVEQSNKQAASIDAVIHDLNHLRLHAGVSYANLTTRITSARQRKGLPEPAARIAKSTVYDCFKQGRRRLSPELVAEIVVALGETEQTALAWRNRCVEAQLNSRPNATPKQEPAAHARTNPGSLQFPAARPNVADARNQSIFATGIPASPQLALLLLCCVGINLFGNNLIMKFSLPIFLDMIGTAIAAIALGPWYGVVVGFSTNMVTTIGGDPISLAFTPVNVAGALLWGYGYHRFGLRTPIRFFALNIIVALGCTLIAVPITALVFGGTVTHWSNDFTWNLVTLGSGIWEAIFTANIVSSLADKLIAGYLGLLASRILSRKGYARF